MPVRPVAGQNREVHAILQLQRTIGNQAVQRLMQVHAEERNAELPCTASSDFRHDVSRDSVRPPAAEAIQTKPAINGPIAHRITGQVVPEPKNVQAGGLTPPSALRAKTIVQCAPGSPQRTPAIQQGLLRRAQKTPLHALKLWGALNTATKNKLLWFFISRCGFGFTHHFHAYAKRGGKPVNTLVYSNNPYFTPQQLRKTGYCKWGRFALARNVFSETWFHYSGREFRTTRWVRGKPSTPPPAITPTKSIVIPPNPVRKYGRVIRRKLNVSNPLGPGTGEAVLYQGGVIEVVLSQRPRKVMTFIPIPGKAGQYHGYSSGGNRVVDPLEDVPAVYTWDSSTLIFLED